MVENTHGNPLLAERIQLEWDGGLRLCLCRGPSPCSTEYTISDEAFVQVDNQEDISYFASKVLPEDGAFDGFTVELSGTSHSGCGWNGTAFSFDVSVLLHPQSISAIYVNIPNNVMSQIFGEGIPSVSVTTTIGDVTYPSLLNANENSNDGKKSTN